MKKVLIIIILVELFVIPAWGQHPPFDKNWKVVFEDNFNTFDTSRWKVENNFDHYGEYQVYRTQNKNILRKTEQKNISGLMKFVLNKGIKFENVKDFI